MAWSHFFFLLFVLSNQQTIHSYVETAKDYVVTPTDTIIRCDTTKGHIFVFLPTANVPGREIMIFGTGMGGTFWSMNSIFVVHAKGDRINDATLELYPGFSIDPTIRKYYSFISDGLGGWHLRA